MLQEFTTWLLGLVHAWFTAIWDFFADYLVSVLDQLLGAVAFLVSQIPLPDWLANGLQSVFGQLDPAILYLLGACGFGPALAVYGSGWVFRLVRKFATVFQW